MSKKILLIDDDEGFRAMLSTLLARNGFVVVEARDGKDGLLKFQAEAVDLVITDIIMPEQDGTGVIIALQKLQATIPVIAISGGGRNTGDDYLKIATIFGARKCFGKPLNTAEFIDTVKELLGT